MELITKVRASPDAVFHACLDVGMHTRSMEQSAERAIAGATTGVLAAGDVVTWQARHFGIRWRMTVRITGYQRPRRFVDEQVSGPFRRWRHEHHFTPDPLDPACTIMRDVIEFTAPVGAAGAVVSALVLRPYLRRLIARRNAFLAVAVAAP